MQKKYENVMFTNQGDGRSKLEIKLIDFGLSMKYGRSRKGILDMSTTMSDFVGTIYTSEFASVMLWTFLNLHNLTLESFVMLCSGT